MNASSAFVASGWASGAQRASWETATTAADSLVNVRGAACVDDECDFRNKLPSPLSRIESAIWLVETNAAKSVTIKAHVPCEHNITLKPKLCKTHLPKAQPMTRPCTWRAPTHQRLIKQQNNIKPHGLQTCKQNCTGVCFLEELPSSNCCSDRITTATLLLNASLQVMSKSHEFSVCCSGSCSLIGRDT
jgi:hypothetical protein